MEIFARRFCQDKHSVTNFAYRSFDIGMRLLRYHFTFQVLIRSLRYCWQCHNCFSETIFLFLDPF